MGQINSSSFNTSLIHSCALGFAFTSIFCLPVQAQLAADSSIGTSITFDEGGAYILGGTVRGQNLFHSFSELSVPTNEFLFFESSEAIANIFTRVTGDLPSKLDGEISPASPVNLFLINPNGITF